MENKTIRRNLYRVLRKTGISKQDISINAMFEEDLAFDTTDWSVFAFYLENMFKIKINDEDFKSMYCINDTINVLKNSA